MNVLVQGTQAELTLTWRNGVRCVVKRYADAAGFIRETMAYAHVLPALAGAVPDVLEIDAPTRTLVLRYVQGERVEGARALECTLWRQAGVFVARLRAIPFADPDAVSLARALTHRFDKWRSHAKPALTQLPRAPDFSVFEGVARTYCHRDFGPHNWIAAHVLTVVDFGQARPDDWLYDLTKLTFPGAAAHAAFMEGLGVELTLNERARLRALVRLHAVATLGYGVRHRDEERIAEGRALLGAEDALPW